MKEYNALTVVPVTMSSREIAELTGKRHADVMRDIRVMAERLKADADLRWHCETETYMDEQGKPREMYRLDKDTTLTLVAGYDAVLRFRIIKRWQELETAQQTALPPPKAPKLTREERYRLGVYRDAVKTAELVGLSGNMARLAADAYCKNTLGCSILEPLGATHLLADEQGRVYTPTELGRMLVAQLSARQLNLALEAAGLQKREMGEWMPTDDAKGLFEWADTAKRHSGGTPVKQLRWFKAVLSRLPSQQEAA